MDLIFKFVFDALFVVVYMLLMVALFLALLTRGIRLWVFMMLSPVFGLLYFFGKTDGGGKMEKFSPKEFIALAMVPVYAAAALAFGLTFILVATEGIKVATSEDDLDTLKAGGFSLTIIGAHGDGGVEEKSVIGKLIVELFGVAILWIAVMAALGASKTTEAVIQPIAKFGEDVGSLVAKAPTYAPIIPTPSGGFQSAQSLSTISGQIKSGIESREVQRGSEFVKSNFPNVGSTGTVDLSSNSMKAMNTLSNSARKLGDPQVWQEFKSTLAGGGSTAALAGNREFMNLLNGMLKEAGKDEVSATNSGVLRGVSILDSIAEDGTYRQVSGGGVIDNNKRYSEGSLVDQRVLDNILSSGSLSSSGGSPEASVDGGNTTNNITITGIGTGTFSSPEEAARAFKKDTSFADAAAVRSRLQRDDDLNSGVIDSIVDAYETLTDAANTGGGDDD